MKVALMQVEDVLRSMQPGFKDTIVKNGKKAATAGVRAQIDYLNSAEQNFRGVGASLPLNEAMLFEQSVSGAETSLLKRISGDPKHKGQPGVLARYGSSVIDSFEKTMQLGIATSKPWLEMRDELVSSSPFLQGAPASWAERILRTEVHAAYNRAGWESVRRADTQLGDMVKILAATFDDRTSWDSYQVHGQIRRPQEAFEGAFGSYQHPPNRPNDRETVVPHRISWALPDSLEPKTDDEVEERYHEENPKGPGPGPRPNMSTIDRALFGKAGETPPPEEPPIEEPPPDDPPIEPPAPPVTVEEKKELQPTTQVQVPQRVRGQLTPEEIRAKSVPVFTDRETIADLKDGLDLSKESQRFVRDGTRNFLQQRYGLNEGDAASDATARFRSGDKAFELEIKSDSKLPGAFADHHPVTGKIRMRGSIARQFGAAVEELETGAFHGEEGEKLRAGSIGGQRTHVFIQEQFKGYSTAMHEEIHGSSPVPWSARGKLGVGIEEATTEILARKAARESFGYTEPCGEVPWGLPVPKRLGGYNENGNGSYQNFIAPFVWETAEALWQAEQHQRSIAGEPLLPDSYVRPDKPGGLSSVMQRALAAIERGCVAYRSNTSILKSDNEAIDALVDGMGLSDDEKKRLSKNLKSASSPFSDKWRPSTNSIRVNRFDDGR